MKSHQSIREYERKQEEERRAELDRMSREEYKGKWSMSKLFRMLIGAKGDCYEQMIATWKKLSKMEAKMMLGEIRSKAGEWQNFDCGRGMPLWHCWVEYRDMVYDTSQGQNILMPREMYYKAFRVQTSREYPTTSTAPKATDKGLSYSMEIPSPRELDFVRDIIRKQYRLGRRDFTDDISAIIE